MSRRIDAQKAMPPQTDFWPELAHPSMVGLTPLCWRAADARSGREDAAARRQERALGIYGENAVTLTFSKGSKQ